MDYPDPKTEYIESRTHISLRALADKWDMALSTLGNRSSREGWVQQREQYWHTVETKTREKTAEDQAEQIAETRQRYVHIGLTASQLIAKQLRAVSVTDDPGDIRTLVNAAETAQRIEWKALNIDEAESDPTIDNPQALLEDYLAATEKFDTTTDAV